MANDEMKSIGELMDEMGYPNKTERVLPPQDPAYYAPIIADHWAAQRPKIWPLMLSKGVPEIFLQLLQQPTQMRETPAIVTIESWAKSRDLILVMHGPAGIGKSFAVAYWLSTLSKLVRTQFGDEPWLQYRYIESDWEWVSAPSLVALTDRFDPEIRARQRRLENCKVLVLDELGGRSLSDVSKQVEMLVLKRWGLNLRTIITTNLAGAALEKELGARIGARVGQVGRVVAVGA